jgi:thioester reductase-like protein
VRSYHSLKAANVLGTQEVLRLAVTNGFATRVKPVHYVSTNGVFPFGDEAPPAGCTETADVAATWRDLKVTSFSDKMESVEQQSGRAPYC